MVLGMSERFLQQKVQMVERVCFYKNCLLQMLQVLVASVEVYLSEFNLAAAANKRHPPVRLHLSYSSQSFLSFAVKPFLLRICCQNNTQVIFLLLALLVALHFMKSPLSRT